MLGGWRPAGSGLEDLEGVASYPELQVVRITGNSVASLKTLGKLKHLVSIDAARNALTDVLDLEPPAENLRAANLSFNSITSVGDRLASYSKLTRLHLDGNKLTTLEGFQHITGLEVLTVSQNELTNCNGLQSLKALRKLDVSRNRIEFFGDLSGLASLETLKAAENKVKSLAEVTPLQSLLELDIPNNHIVSLEEIIYLKGLPMLKNLDITGNPMVDATDMRLHVLYLLPALVTLDNISATAEEKVHAFNLHGADSVATRAIRKKFFPYGELEDGGGAMLPPTASLVEFNDPNEFKAILERKDFQDIDDYVEKLSTSELEAVSTFEELFQLLCPSGKDEVASVRACFKWVAGNIAVPSGSVWVTGIPILKAGLRGLEAKLMEAIEGCWVEKVAGFLCALVEAGGIQAQRIVGYGKWDGFDLGSVCQTPNHSWVALRIQGMWWLLDCVRCNYVLGTQFLVRPEEFVYTHFPLEPRWQLLPEPLSLQSFWELAQCTPSFFLAGLQVLGGTRSVETATTGLEVAPYTLEVAAPVGVLLHHDLLDSDDNTVVAKESATTFGMCDRSYGEKNVIKLLTAIPAPGTYNLRITATRGGASTSVLRMKLNVDKAAGSRDHSVPPADLPICLPLALPRWRENLCKLVAPVQGAVWGNKHTTFDVVVPGARAVAVHLEGSGVRWSDLELVDMGAGSFQASLQIPNQAGQLTLAAKFEGSPHWEPLLAFTVKRAIVALKEKVLPRAELASPSLEDAAVADSKAQFDKIDLDGDGQISKKDILRAVKKEKEALEKLKLPSDVSMHSDSMNTFYQAFDRIDADQSGSISWPEIASFLGH